MKREGSVGVSFTVGGHTRGVTEAASTREPSVFTEISDSNCLGAPWTPACRASVHGNYLETHQPDHFCDW